VASGSLYPLTFVVDNDIINMSTIATHQGKNVSPDETLKEKRSGKHGYYAVSCGRYGD
jgi:hypothetical protein